MALITPPTPLTAPVVMANTGLASHDLTATQEILELEGYFIMESCYRSRGL